MPKAKTPAPAPHGGIRAIKKLMVANRSEIAIRVFRAANELGLNADYEIPGINTELGKVEPALAGTGGVLK